MTGYKRSLDFLMAVYLSPPLFDSSVPTWSIRGSRSSWHGFLYFALSPDRRNVPARNYDGYGMSALVGSCPNAQLKIASNCVYSRPRKELRVAARVGYQFPFTHASRTRHDKKDTTTRSGHSVGIQFVPPSRPMISKRLFHRKELFRLEARIRDSDNVCKNSKDRWVRLVMYELLEFIWFNEPLGVSISLALFEQYQVYASR